MLAQRIALRVGRAAAASSVRPFASSSRASKDFVQDLYLREVKSYKPKEVSANAHVGQVKEFHSPSAPQAPVVPTGADLAKELEAYDREEVGADPSSTSAASTEASDSAPGQTADEFLEHVMKEARHQPKPDSGHH